MPLKKNEILINDSTDPDLIYNPRVGGETKGHGAIPRDYSVQPRSMFKPPSEMQVIPENEWSDRIKEKVATKSQISDIRLHALNGQMIPALDQNGQGFSHSADTEILTNNGWVAWPDYNGTDLLASVNQLTGLMEFQAPTERHAYEYTDEMVYGTNRRLDFGVTGNHRMMVRKWNEAKRTLSDQYSFVRADKIGWYCGMMHAPRGFIGTNYDRLSIDGDRDYAGDDFLAMVALIVSDGYVRGDGNFGHVSFCCFRPDRMEMVRRLAARVGFKEQPSRPGVWHRYDAHALAAWVRANCYMKEPLRAQNKKVPELVKWATMRQIRHFLKFYGDQNHGEDADTTFYSASKQIIDDLQELHLRINKRSSIGERAARDIPFAGNVSGVIHTGISHTLHVSETDKLCVVKKKHIEKEPYKGLVYCATVPNGTLVTRRNGSVLISGNCWAYSTGSAIMMLRALAHQPYVRVSPHGPACIIKKFRDEGGWGALSLQFAMEKGYPSEQFWPQKSMSKANDKPETWANAALHKVTEGWVDMSADAYDRKLSFQQVATCLLLNVPVVVDFNWWSHSVCAIDLVEIEKGSFGVRILNSWGDGWSEQGTGVLQGNKARPDGAVAPYGTLASGV